VTIAQGHAVECEALPIIYDVGGALLFFVLMAKEAAAIALMAAAGLLLADTAIKAELNVVRGVRVSLDARKALEQHSRPPGVEGLLTIVSQNEYLVHTASVSRAGTPLRADDSEDKARAERHAAAKIKKSIRERVDGGAWRATVADPSGDMTAELISNPPAVLRPSIWIGAGIALFAGFLLMFLLRLKTTPRIAASVGLTAAAAVVLYFTKSHVGLASQAAIAYLAESTGSPPGVAIAPIKVLAWPLALYVLLLLLVLISSRRRDQVTK
jgi:hypothetical protein